MDIINLLYFLIGLPILKLEGVRIENNLPKYRFKRAMSCREDDCGQVNGIDYCWNINSGSYYFATPHCLDQYNYLQERYCVNGNFTEKIKCSDVQRNITFCEENYKESIPGCYRELKATTHYKSNCPYKNFLYFPFSTSNKFTWFPAKREVNEDNIGEFVIYEASKNYGKIIDDYEYNNISGANCLVYNDTIYKAVSCNNTYQRICGYKYLHDAHDDYCYKKHGGIDAYFNKSKQVCIYINRNKSIIIHHDSKNHLQYPYQNSIIHFMDHRNCSFNSIYRYTNSTLKAHYNYTFWSNIEQDLTGKQIILTKSGWKLSTHYFFPRCSIIENTYETKTPQISIDFITKNSSIIKNVTYEEYLASFENRTIFCFTNAKALHIYEIFDETEKIENSGLYWCEGFHISTYELIKSNVINITNIEDVYVVELWMNYTHKENPTSSKFISKKFELLKNNFSAKFIWMKTLELQTNAAKYLIHIHTPLDKTEYSNKRNLIEKFLNTSKVIFNSSKVRTTKYCLKEITLSNNYVLTWNETEVNKSARPDKNCVDKNGYPISRSCTYDFYYGAQWSDFSNCYGVDEDFSEHTGKLYDLLKSNASTKDLTEQLGNLTGKAEEYVALDVHFAASIIEKFETKEVDLIAFSNILSNLMNGKKAIMSGSQIKTNATDRILDRFDVILKHQSLGEFIPTDNLFLFNFLPNNTCTGLGLIKNNSGYDGVILNTTNFLGIKNLVAATIIPQEILSEIIENNIKDLISIYIFTKNSYFNGGDDEINHDENIGIILPEGIKKAFELPIYFKSNQQENCAFWDYGLEKRGNWRKERKAEIIEGFNVCKFSHTTHFGLLVSNEKIDNDNILQIITAVCCFLSFIGTLGIITTALLFKTWRQNHGNVILLNYSIVTFVQIILLYLADTVGNSRDVCVLIGASLQFSVLSQFCWMLVFGFLQYKRYVRVFSGLQNWLLPKAFVFSYVTPSIPVIILLVLFEDTFTKGNGSLCYPTGNSLIYGVLMPISLIIGANLVILVKVILELFCYKRTKCVDDDIFMLRLRLLLLMFFMLGITWCFGLIAQIFDCLACIYIFTTTASLQGFVIFIFYIVLNKNARIMYAYMWRKHQICY